MVHSSYDGASDIQNGAVMPPVYLSTNYSFEGLDGKREYDYSRSGNPTRDVLAKTICKLEGGHDAVITNTGMSSWHHEACCIDARGSK